MKPWLLLYEFNERCCLWLGQQSWLALDVLRYLSVEVVFRRRRFRLDFNVCQGVLIPFFKPVYFLECHTSNIPPSINASTSLFKLTKVTSEYPQWIQLQLYEPHIWNPPSACTGNYLLAQQCMARHLKLQSQSHVLQSCPELCWMPAANTFLVKINTKHEKLSPGGPGFRSYTPVRHIPSHEIAVGDMGILSVFMKMQG